MPVLTLLQLTAYTTATAPVVDAPWGRVQGVVIGGDGSRKVHGFLGVPYARPPVGHLRFEKPQPHPGPGPGQTFVAENTSPACYQIPFLIGSDRQLSEDCLILDIYVPTTPAVALRPVMFFIHGGGFAMGDAPYYRPSKLVVDEDLIVVVIQYRLGVFGFLITGDGVLPPNLGLWDQNLALRWVRDNIAAFGGDPDMVTIFGESAGSMSVGMHTVSPHSKGLFKRAIQQSGAPHGLFGISSLIVPELFVNLSKTLDCAGSSTQQRVACLKEIPAAEFQAKASEFAQSMNLLNLALPVIDGDFFLAHPMDILRDADLLAQSSLEDVETIIGFNDQEGALVLFIRLWGNLTDEVMTSRQFFEMNLQFCLAASGLIPSPILAKTAAFHYLGADFDEDRVSLQGLADMYGDCVLTSSIIDWALALADNPRTAPKYMYVMEHEFAFNKGRDLPGSHHGDELTFLFDSEQLFPKNSIFNLLNKTAGLSEEEKPLAAMFSKLFGSFARSGTPDLVSPGTGQWPQFTRDTQQFLSISNTPKVVDNLGRYKVRWALWNKLLSELNKLTAGQSQGQGPEESRAENADKAEEKGKKQEL